MQKSGTQKSSMMPIVHCNGQLCSLSWIIRRGVVPMHNIMKIFGLTYGSTCPLITKIGTRHKIERAYTVGVALLILVSVIRWLPCLFNSNTAYPSFLGYEYSLWTVKSAIQACYCIFIGHRYGRKISRLQELIHGYDIQIERYMDTADQKLNRRYLKMSRLILFFLLATAITKITMFIVVSFLPTFKDHYSVTVAYEPFTNPSIPIKLLYIIGYTYLIVAWLLPVNLYCALCLSLCLIFDQFLTSVKAIHCNKIRSRIKYIREEYQKLEGLVSRTDDLIGFMALCVYLLDVVLFCFHMYNMFYISKGHFINKLGPAYRALISVGNLYFISFCASKVVDKVRQAHPILSSSRQIKKFPQN